MTNNSNLTTAVDVFRHQLGNTRTVVRLATDGLTQAESLLQPEPHGNCANWVLGHLVSVYNHVLPMLGEEMVLPESRLARYERGTAPDLDATEAVDIAELLAAFDKCCDRIDPGLARLSGETLAKPAPLSPTDNPDETIGSLLSTVCWHQAYHVGQLGLLRRIFGKKGAIG
jgi:hypothetical protein